MTAVAFYTFVFDEWLLSFKLFNVRLSGSSDESIDGPVLPGFAAASTTASFSFSSFFTAAGGYYGAYIPKEGTWKALAVLLFVSSGFVTGCEVGAETKLVGFLNDGIAIVVGYCVYYCV